MKQLNHCTGITDFTFHQTTAKKIPSIFFLISVVYRLSSKKFFLVRKVGLPSNEHKKRSFYCVHSRSNLALVNFCYILLLNKNILRKVTEF